MKIKTVTIRDENVKYLILKLLNAIIDEVYFHYVVMKKKDPCTPVDEKIDAIDSFLDKMAINEEYHEIYAGLAAEVSTVISTMRADKRLADALYEIMGDVLKNVKTYNAEGFIDDYRTEKEVN